MFAFLLNFFAYLANPLLQLHFLSFQFLSFDCLVGRVMRIFSDDHEDSHSEKIHKVGNGLNA